MNADKLKQQWIAEENKSFQGWDFSHLDGRWDTEELPWSYEQLIEDYLRPEHQLLDMGTGGGEFLLSLGHPYERTTVTEAWEPNVRLCREKLEPLGVKVTQVFDDASLPLDDDSFDIVINRHEACDTKEIRRILRNNGLLITQQVGASNNHALSRSLLPGFLPPYPEQTLDRQLELLRLLQFEVLHQHEHFPRLRFYDIGAVVFFAKIIEWEFPGFSVEKCFQELCELQKTLLAEGCVESREHRFMIVAKNRK